MNKKSVTALAAACLLVAGFLPGGVQATGDAELQKARAELRLRAETERRMRRDFESLLAGGRMSAVDVADFENYLARLAMLVDKQRGMVARLEERPAGSSDTDPRAALPAGFDRGQTDAEKIALLDAELGSSLSEFDEKLLREQEELAEKSRAASTGESGDNQEPGAGASAKAGEGQGEKTQGESKDGTGKNDGESAAESGEKTGDSEQQAPDSADGNDSAGGNDKVASTGSAGGDKTKTSTPADIPDGRDDDIVARQLREAAENEQDPELRDKLWEEYRNYKNRTR